jgi:hypothetical protein
MSSGNEIADAARNPTGGSMTALARVQGGAWLPGTDLRSLDNCG